MLTGETANSECAGLLADANTASEVRLRELKEEYEDALTSLKSIIERLRISVNENSGAKLTIYVTAALEEYAGWSMPNHEDDDIGDDGASEDPQSAEEPALEARDTTTSSSPSIVGMCR